MLHTAIPRRSCLVKPPLTEPSFKSRLHLRACSSFRTTRLHALLFICRFELLCVRRAVVGSIMCLKLGMPARPRLWFLLLRLRACSAFPVLDEERRERWRPDAWPRWWPLRGRQRERDRGERVIEVTVLCRVGFFLLRVLTYSVS